MPIKGPKGAHPTLRGWINPKTGELLKSQKISQAAIDEFFGVTIEGPFEDAVQAIEEVIEEVIEDLNNDGVIDQFEGMTKADILAYADENGIEVDHKLSRTKLVEALQGLSNA
jgi:hypothetical protein